MRPALLPDARQRVQLTVTLWGEIRMFSIDAEGDGWRIIRDSCGSYAVAVELSVDELSVDELAALRKRDRMVREAQKMDTVARLAGGAVHDLNNMLTAILSHCRLAAGRVGPDDPVSDDIAQIAVAARRAAELTQQILAFGRRQPVESEVTDLFAIVVETESLLRRVIAEHITFRVSVDDGQGWVEVGASQLEQLIVNLVLNARDATPKGGVVALRAEIKTVRAATDAPPGMALEPGPYVMLTVSDTGVGMDEATVAQAFEPLFTTKAPGEGIGLGLSTVREIVRQSGGEISVESAPEVGTTFRLCFPRAPPSQEQRPAPLRQPCEGLGGTVLVVEDEAIVCLSTCMLLEDAGCDVFSAGGAKEALRICAQHGEKIDVLLSDVVMPDMSGPELATELRRAYPHIRVILTSGHSREVLAQDDAGDLEVDFLAKPYEPEELCDAVRKALQSGRS